MWLLSHRLPDGPGSGDGVSVPPDHGQLIGRSFYIYTRVRTAVVLAIVMAAVFGRYVLGMDAIDVKGLTVLAAFITLYNVVAWFFFRRYRDPEAPAESLTVLLFLTYAAVVLDFIALTIAIWFVGGARSPFTSFYILHMLVSCTLLPRRAAIELTTLAYGLLGGLVAVEWTGLATPPIPVGAVAGDGPLDARYAFTILVVNGSLFAMSAFLLLAITRSLQHLEQRMRLANSELVRLSQQRKDFLHIAAHNLRAPLGAVTMLLDNMRGGLAGPTTEKQRDWLDRSLKRLADLSEFMRGIQTLASLESDIIKTQFSRVDLGAVASRLVDEYEDVAAERGHELVLEAPERVPPVVGHDRLLQEALVNYVTNAIKYTPNGGRIAVRVLSRPPMVRVEVSDSGVGIAPEDQGRLFQEFFRVPGGGGKPNKIKGSGLGLSIVRRVVLAHGGRTGVESEAGKGSTFFMELPAVVE
jgi:signal transduction histidine kinase